MTHTSFFCWSLLDITKDACSSHSVLHSYTLPRFSNAFCITMKACLSILEDTKWFKTDARNYLVLKFAFVHLTRGSLEFVLSHMQLLHKLEHYTSIVAHFFEHNHYYC